MMYEEEKFRRNRHKSPSFSSSLLDEIYRSIDENSRNGGNGGIQEAYKPNLSTKKQAQSNKAVLVEKWVEKQGSYTHHQEDDTLFFSSTSLSSDSSSGALSSDNEFFGSVKSSRSCFATIKMPKPVKTGKTGDFQKSEVEKNRGDKKTGEKNQDFIKSKSRALKIYANLKKVKEPISPGGKLTTFINNLFANSKKNPSSSSQCSEIRKPSTTTTSTCSSASSFSRSCLSKSSPNSKARFNDGTRRTVTFYPVSVIVDEENRPCGKKFISDTFPQEVSLKVPEMKKTGPVQPDRKNFKNEVPARVPSRNLGYNAYEEDEDEDEDALSDCSSDLFEIDHRAMFGSHRFCEELPVYETTRIRDLIR